jgi:ComF family protein
VTLHARGLFDSIVDLFLPRRCVQCAVAGAWLCADCATALPSLREPCCPRCGCPGSTAATCRECRGRGLAFGGAAAAFAYAGPARSLVSACKFRGLRSIASELADQAAPRFASFAAQVGALAVTSVPPHRDHQLERGFNQAELLARELAAGARLPYVSLLARRREARTQHDLGREARAANAQGAFIARPSTGQASEKLKRVVIVDDVYTTGETLNSCAAALVQLGFEPYVFTFARTARAFSNAIDASSAPRRGYRGEESAFRKQGEKERRP